MTPKVSIIIPCYGVEEYLDRCVESIVNQTLKDIEIILVDDGSPDKVPQMCDIWAKKDLRIKVIHKQNEGLGLARNSGLELASGEYVAFVDSDDYVDTSMYEKLYSAATKTCSDVVFCGYYSEISQSKWISYIDQRTCGLITGDEVKKYLLDMVAGNPMERKERLHSMSVWHSIYKKGLIDKHSLKFESERVVLSEDIPFQTDILLNSNRLYYLQEALYFHCLNKESLSSTFKSDKYKKISVLCQVLTDKLKGIDSASYRIDRLYIGYTRSQIQTLYKSNVHHKKNVLRKLLSEDKQLKSISKRYPTDSLPLYNRIFFNLSIGNHVLLLHYYCKLVVLIKKTLSIRH